MTFLLESPLLPILFLFGSLVLTACATALLHLGKYKSREVLRVHPLKFLLPKHEWEGLYFSVSVCKHIYQLAYAIFSFFYLLSISPSLQKAFSNVPISHQWTSLLAAGGGIIALSLVLDYTTRLLANLWSKRALSIALPLATLYLLCLFPLTALLLYGTRHLFRGLHLQEESKLFDKSKLRELIRDSELQQHLEPADQKLIGSFLNFKERIAKEIMVPRVDLFALEASTTIHEATRLFAKEGYSRIPIYRGSFDQIAGVVLYKDLLKCYAAPKPALEAPLDSIAKPVLYAPENKKISQLLQEFRNKQIHMAIIVDEYGGTEGIVTIEDILEELVGEIEDEYDIDEDADFSEIPGGGWVIDAKMSIVDIEEKLGIQIPPSPEYETIGGYVFHCAGTIPAKGWRLSHDQFDLEVLSSNERSLKKLKILPRNKKKETPS
ncbi:MAG: HlyC/CorC family transporter [Verrucomicrobiota bacterium]|nr:HlyC/CorC family transporter [Verrucomicrobiota bacterium]